MGERDPAHAAPGTLQLGPVREESLAQVVAIHRAQIGYSLNSKLGAEHLGRMYRVVDRDEDSLISVAYLDAAPVGVVMATLDPSRLMRRLLGGLAPRQWLQLAMRAVAAPSAIVEWLEGLWVGRPVAHGDHTVTACLLAIAVQGDVQGHGVGRRLVGAVDDFCRRKGHAAYRLDTRAGNAGAQAFYRRNGFVHVDRRGRNTIWVKQVEQIQT